MTTASPGDAGVVALGDRAESTYGGTGGDRTLGTFTGWVDLLRLVLRRDRIQLLIWIAAVAGLVLVSAVSIDGLYPTQADRDGYAALVDGNAAVVVPLYGQLNDQAALDALKPFFPGRDIVGLPSDAILAGGGSFHCTSQQMPSAGPSS